MKAGFDYIGLSVFVLISNNKNEVLLAYHKLTDKKPKGLSECWAMPDGTVEFRETDIEALRREIGEEFGMKIYDEYITEDRH